MSGKIRNILQCHLLCSRFLLGVSGPATDRRRNVIQSIYLYHIYYQLYFYMYNEMLEKHPATKYVNRLKTLLNMLPHRIEIQIHIINVVVLCCLFINCIIYYILLFYDSVLLFVRFYMLVYTITSAIMGTFQYLK